MKYVRKYPRNRTFNQRKFEFWEKMLGENGINSKLKHRKLITLFYPGELVTHTGDQEIVVISGRLLDNLGEWACMSFKLKQRIEAARKKSVL